MERVSPIPLVWGHDMMRQAMVLVMGLALATSCGDGGPGNPNNPGPGIPGQAIVGDAWQYAAETDPGFSGYWSFGASGGTNPPNVMTLVDLVTDPIFGKVARITQPGGSSLSPQLAESFPDLDKAWIHFYIKFSPGWTATGATGPSSGNAWKLMHLYMPGGGSTGRTRIEVENSVQFGCGFAYPNRSYNVTYIPTSHLGCATSTELGSDEFQDGDWYEWVVYHEKTGATTGKLRYWERRFTVNGTQNPGPWWFKGTDIVGDTGTDLFPPVNQIHLGVNKNRDTPTTQYVYWGPWEIMNGNLDPNPYGVGP
jgi:hypothetical protein